MRKLLLALVLLVMSVSVAHAELKIGVVDMQVIASSSEPAKDAKKKMEAKFGDEKVELEKEAKALQAKGQALQKKPTEAKQVEFIKLKRKFDEKQYKFARSVEKDEVKIRQEMVTLVFRAAYEVAQAKGFNYVVDVTAGGILYADQNMDLTDDVLAEVNKLWKSGALKKEEKKEEKKK